MPRAPLPLPFPVRGVVQNVAYANQPPLTTQNALNVRGYDPLTARNRGGQRSGMSKACSVQISGANPIQCIAPFVWTFGSPTLSSKTVINLAVSQGNVKKFLPGSATTVTNGASALSSVYVPIFASQLNSKLFFADGVNFKYFDGSSQSMLAITAASGSLPTDAGGNAPRLCAVWRGRLVYSGLPLDPFNWFMSGVNDETNWGYNPIPSVETQPVAGNDGGAGSLLGQAPDLVNCIIPYSNEILIFGGARSITQMTGDPMSGGRFDLVSDGIGVGYGRPFCRDGQGIVYFFASNGSIYKFIPGALPERISDPITFQVQTTDTSANVVSMVWDEFQHGFHVWVTPVGSPAICLHFFYDQPNQAWHIDQYANNNMNPLCVSEGLGDTAITRGPLVGGFDGYIRQLDYTAKDDDGTAMNSNCTFGPFGMPGSYVVDIQCDMANTSDPVLWTLFSGPAADDVATGLNTGLGRLTRTGTFVAGRNPSQAVRQFGHAHYITLQGLQQANSSWQLESLVVILQTSEGTARQRMF